MYTSTLLASLKKVCKCIKNISYSVLPCDQLLSFKITTRKVVLIANYDSSAQEGSHWVLMYINDYNSPLEFYDSYGMPFSMFPKHFSDFVVKNNLRIKQYAGKQLQDMYSKVCGQYCLYIAYKRLQGCSMSQIYKCLSKDYKKNDKLVAYFYKKQYNIKNICRSISDQSCTCFVKK